MRVDELLQKVIVGYELDDGDVTSLILHDGISVSVRYDRDRDMAALCAKRPGTDDTEEVVV